MNFWVKLEDGTFRKATESEILDPNVVLYSQAGEKEKGFTYTVSRSMPSTTTTKAIDPITELENTVKDLCVDAEELRKAKDETKKALAEIKELQAKGFPIGMPQAETRSGAAWFGGDIENMDQDQKDAYPYNLSAQGRNLVDAAYVKHPVTEEKRLMMAKYFTTWIKAAYFNDPKAKADYQKNYVRPNDMSVKTAIGDSGNVFPVPDIIETEILHFAREKSVVLQDARIVPMTSEFDTFPVESAGTTARWGNTTQQSDPTIDEVELTAYELSSFTEARNTQLADSRSDIVSWLTDLMANAVGLELDNSAFNGDGTSTYGACSGLLSAACGYSVTMGAGSTAFSNITATLLSEMIAALDGVKKNGAKFYMHGSNLHYVRTLKDSNDRPIFMDGHIGTGVPPTIYGYPYKEVTNMPSTSAANTAFMNFGNMIYFLAGRRLDSMKLEVDPWGLWTTNRTRFKIYNRWGLKIGLENGFVRMLTHS